MVVARQDAVLRTGRKPSYYINWKSGQLIDKQFPG